MKMDLKRKPVPLMLFKNEAFHQARPVLPDKHPTYDNEKCLNRSQENELCTNRQLHIKSEPEDEARDRYNGVEYNESGIKCENLEDNDLIELPCSFSPSVNNRHRLHDPAHSHVSHTSNDVQSIVHDSSSDSDVDIDSIPNIPHFISTHLPLSSSSRKGPKSIMGAQRRRGPSAKYIADYRSGLDHTADFHTYAKPVTPSNVPLQDKEIESLSKRLHHNRLERSRRQRMGDLFLDLSKEIPVLSKCKMNSKVSILNEAVSYILSLRIYLQSQNEVIIQESHKNLSLREDLQYLQLQSYPTVVLERF